MVDVPQRVKAAWRIDVGQIRQKFVYRCQSVSTPISSYCMTCEINLHAMGGSARQVPVQERAIFAGRDAYCSLELTRERTVVGVTA